MKLNPFRKKTSNTDDTEQQSGNVPKTVEDEELATANSTVPETNDNQATKERRCKECGKQLANVSKHSRCESCRRKRAGTTKRLLSAVGITAGTVTTLVVGENFTKPGK